MTHCAVLARPAHLSHAALCLSVSHAALAHRLIRPTTSSLRFTCARCCTRPLRCVLLRMGVPCRRRTSALHYFSLHYTYSLHHNRLLRGALRCARALDCASPFYISPLPLPRVLYLVCALGRRLTRYLRSSNSPWSLL